MPGHFSHDTVAALKDAAVKVFWTRTDLRSMLNIAGVDQNLITAQNWEQYKYHILSPIVDSLNVSEAGLGPLRRILHETLRYKDCKHLLRFNNGKQLKKEAEQALEYLRSLVKEHDAAQATEEDEREARRRRMEEAQKGRVFQQKLSELHDRYMRLLIKSDENERGYDLEKLLNEMFKLFELSPHSPFRRIGEQIDGAFVLDRDNFLLEAKWQKTPSKLTDLRDLDGAVSSSLDNTLGLFVAVSGFTVDALSGYIAGNRPRLICMDGADLLLVLEGRIDLPELLFRKKEVASQRRKLFVSASDIIMGRT
ncbi:MAG TPA: hypothetical protein VF865_16520 [Acidobacteriaceae bacterium]